MSELVGAAAGTSSSPPHDYALPLFYSLGPFAEPPASYEPPISTAWTNPGDLHPAPKICVVTTAKPEYDAVKARLEPAIGGRGKVLQVSVPDSTILVGKFGNYQAALCQTHQGDGNTKDALAKILRRLPSVRGILAIGFGYGVDPAHVSALGERQMIGDVMVSAKCIHYSHYRADADVNLCHGNHEVCPLSSTLGQTLFNGWACGIENWDEAEDEERSLPERRRPRGPKVHFGPFISLPVLFDNAELLRRFVAGVRDLKPIGNVQLYQIVQAANNHPEKLFWLCITSICDFGGLIAKDKRGQALTAATAVDFARYYLSAPNILDDNIGSPGAPYLAVTPSATPPPGSRSIVGFGGSSPDGVGSADSDAPLYLGSTTRAPRVSNATESAPTLPVSAPQFTLGCVPEEIYRNDPHVELTLRLKNVVENIDSRTDAIIELADIVPKWKFRLACWSTEDIEGGQMVRSPIFRFDAAALLDNLPDSLFENKFVYGDVTTRRQSDGGDIDDKQPRCLKFYRRARLDDKCKLFCFRIEATHNLEDDPSTSSSSAPATHPSAPASTSSAKPPRSRYTRSNSTPAAFTSESNFRNQRRLVFFVRTLCIDALAKDEADLLEKLEVVALRCGYRLLLHKLVWTRIGAEAKAALLSKINRERFVVERILGYLGCDFAASNECDEWAAWKITTTWRRWRLLKKGSIKCSIASSTIAEGDLSEIVKPVTSIRDKADIAPSRLSRLPHIDRVVELKVPANGAHDIDYEPAVDNPSPQAQPPLESSDDDDNATVITSRSEATTASTASKRAYEATSSTSPRMQGDYLVHRSKRRSCWEDSDVSKKTLASVDRPWFVSESSGQPTWLKPGLTARKVFKVTQRSNFLKTPGLEHVHEWEQTDSLDANAQGASGRSLRALQLQVTPKYSFDYDDVKDEISLLPFASGCQAFVYRVDHVDKERKVSEVYALKTLKPAFVNVEEGMRAFQREVNMLALIQHPHVCKLVGISTDTVRRTPCAMLEWVPQTVRCALRLNDLTPSSSSGGAAACRAVRKEVVEEWPSLRRLKLVDEIADALLYLHSGSAITGHCVLHRDLKPENFGVTADGSFKLLDFGLAVCLDLRDEDNFPDLVEQSPTESPPSLQQSSSSFSSSLSSGDSADKRRRKRSRKNRPCGPLTCARFRLTGETGSLRYMSPEVGRYESYGVGADVYSWAISAWEILALRGKPFADMNTATHRKYVIEGGTRPKVPSSFDSTLRILLTGAWDADQSKRPDFREIRRLLKHNINLTHPATGAPVDALDLPKNYASSSANPHERATTSWMTSVLG